MKRFLCIIFLALALLFPGMASSQPPAPSLTATTNGLDFTLSWSSVPDAAGYRLFYAPLPYTGPSSIGQVDMANNTSVSATLWDGASFAVAVHAYNGSGASPLSNIEQFLVDQNSGNYRLPDTGITKCIDDKGEIACPEPGQPFYGQDAQYDGPQLDYQDNGNGTVTDLNTGLVWQQGDDDATRTWQEAIDYCASLSLGENNDWRLPDRHELFSIVDLGRSAPGPAIDPVFTSHSSRYWSDSTYADGADRAWYVAFRYGRVGYNDKNDNLNLYFARCVRGGL